MSYSNHANTRHNGYKGVLSAAARLGKRVHGRSSPRSRCVIHVARGSTRRAETGTGVT
ncbi:hypothetical protein PLANTIT3_20194 [Plantibacter sp. T3]|nr:hypothetical protein PLANTIT3_20194 [Plantibacter sp. T3]